jgi:hypothetical protein
MDWIIARLSEPSSWASAAGGVGAVGVALAAGQPLWLAIVGGIAAVFGIVLPEKK